MYCIDEERAAAGGERERGIRVWRARSQGPGFETMSAYRRRWRQRAEAALVPWQLGRRASCLFRRGRRVLGSAGETEEKEEWERVIFYLSFLRKKK
jgi:hypothetical protein